MSKKQIQPDTGEQTEPSATAQENPPGLEVGESVKPVGDGEGNSADGGAQEKTDPGAESQPQASGNEGVHNEEAPFGYKADGTPRKNNAGRRPVSASDESDKQRNRLRSVTPTTAKPKRTPPVEVTPLAVVNYQAMGESVASMWFHGGEMIFGEEWAPDTQAGEHLAVAGAFRDYFKATNMRDLPPGFALCFVLGVYSLKRANKPTVKTKLQGIGLWLKSNLRIVRRG